jgi:hypothetical protein
MDFPFDLAAYAIALSPKLLNLSPSYHRKLIKEPSRRENILYEHCDYTSIKVAFLVNIRYGIGIENSEFTEITPDDLIKKILSEDNMLFTANTFITDQPGHAFSFVKYKGELYLIDSAYFEFRTQCAKFTDELLVKFMARNFKNLKYNSTPISEEDFAINCRYYATLESL